MGGSFDQGKGLEGRLVRAAPGEATKPPGRWGASTGWWEGGGQRRKSREAGSHGTVKVSAVLV